MKVTKPAKALIFGFCCYLAGNTLIFLVLALKEAQAPTTGLLANKIFLYFLKYLVIPLGFLSTFPFFHFFYKKTMTRLELLLALDAIFWGLVFYVVLVILERRKRVSQNKTQ
jgi:hypothetical protein